MIIIMACVVGYLLYRRRTRLIAHEEGGSTPKGNEQPGAQAIALSPSSTYVDQHVADQDASKNVMSISKEGKVRNITGEE